MMDKICEINPSVGSDCITCVPSHVKNSFFSLEFVSTPKKVSDSKIRCQIITVLTDTDKNRTENKVETDAVQNGAQLILGKVSDIPEKLFSAVFVIRPYVEQDGLRGYGDAKVFYYSGTTENGMPEITTERPAVCDSIFPSHDTYIRNMEGKIYGSEETLEIKNKGDGDPMTRYLYLKFDIPENMVDVLLGEKEIHLQLHLKITRTKLSKQETENGGILVNVFKTDTDWDEATLCYANADRVKVMEKLGELRVDGSDTVKLDITEYLHNELKNGVRSFSFRLENAENDGDNSQSVYFSKENSSVSHRPKISFGEPAFTREFYIAAPELEDFQYEPWGYAERVVHEWITETYDKIYPADDDREVFELETLDITKPTGSHTVLVEGKRSPNPPSNPFNKYYARTIDSMIEKGGFVEDSANFSRFDEFGGITNSGIKSKATGYFHTEMIGGRAFLINPLGNPTYLIGLGQMQIGQTDNHKAVSIEKYGSVEGFWESITKELKEKAGVNMSNGAISYATVTSTPMIAVGGVSGIQGYMKKLGLVVSDGVAPVYKYNNVLNVFDPGFLPYVMETNKATLERNADNIYLIGYTSDNELTSDEHLLDKYLFADSSAYCNAFSYAVAWTFLTERTKKINPSLADVTPELRKEFKSLVFSKILGAVRQAIDTYAPNHMYLGNRTDAGNKSSEAYLRVAGYYCDMLSINMYDGIQPSVATMATIYRYSGKPFFVTEFYSKADDAIDMNGQHLANQQNAGFHVKNQKDRAAYYENYTTLLLECKYCVGWTWFTFRDNDQSLYYPSQSDTSKILRVWQKGQNKDIVSFIDQDGNVVNATGNEYRFYTGCDFDMSSLGSNKGLLDNRLNFYPELTASFKRISDNFINLINYFDNLHK